MTTSDPASRPVTSRLLGGRRMRAVLIVAAIVLALGSGAVGIVIAGATPPSKTASHASSSLRHVPRASRKKAREAFRACLSSHGVTLPAHPAAGGTASAGKASGGTARSNAFAICRALLVSSHGGIGRLRTGLSPPTARQQAALATYEQCMASHGVQIAAGSTITAVRRLRRADPAAASANKQCHSDLSGVFKPPGTHRAG